MTSPTSVCLGRLDPVGINMSSFEHAGMVVCVLRAHVATLPVHLSSWSHWLLIEKPSGLHKYTKGPSI